MQKPSVFPWDLAEKFRYIGFVDRSIAMPEVILRQVIVQKPSVFPWDLAGNFDVDVFDEKAEKNSPAV